MKRIAPYIILSLCMIFLISCGGEDYTPKPKAYLRIELPQKSYQTFDSVFPYSFEYPSYSTIQFSNKSDDSKYWINLNFPTFNATLHFTYKPVKNDLDSLIDNARRFVDKHIPKATSIKEKTYENPENNVYAVVYDIKGNAVASPYQFFATDKKKHYLRGALYFNMEPSNDSLAPVINFIEKDIDYLISKLKWK